MFSNEFVEITCVAPDCRYSWRKSCGFNQTSKSANELLSTLVRDSFSAYGKLPFITSQMVEEGELEFYSHFVTFPKPSDTRYIVRYMVINDLPF
ncbi:MAG: hypothetical protein [Microviridae sp.]|nr:MAG: hypothetical protein [Microviridae sp.]